MARVVQWQPADCRLWPVRALALLSGCLILGACAQSTPHLGASNLLAQAELTDSAKGKQPEAAPSQSELEKATEWWGKKYAENPRDLEAALSYARNLKAMGERKRALSVLQQASIFHGDDKQLAGEYGRLALEFDQVGLANRLLAAADDPLKPDWRVISARGTVLAKQGKYGDAIPFFERALTLSRDHPSVLSNLALAHAMNGEPDKAETLLRQAAASDGTSHKIRQNLALVLGLQGKYDEAKLLAAQDISPEKAAANADYLRRIVRLEPKRIPAPNTDPQIAAIPQQDAAPVAQVQPVAAVEHEDATPRTLTQLARQQPPALPVRKPVAAMVKQRNAAPPLIANAQGFVSGTAHVANMAQKATKLPAMKPALEPDSAPWATQVALTDTHKPQVGD